jgi:hypothetical protein
MVFYSLPAKVPSPPLVAPAAETDGAFNWMPARSSEPATGVVPKLPALVAQGDSATFTTGFLHSNRQGNWFPGGSDSVWPTAGGWSYCKGGIEIFPSLLEGGSTRRASESNPVTCSGAVDPPTREATAPAGRQTQAASLAEEMLAHMPQGERQATAKSSSGLAADLKELSPLVSGMAKGLERGAQKIESMAKAVFHHVG